MKPAYFFIVSVWSLLGTPNLFSSRAIGMPRECMGWQGIFEEIPKNQFPIRDEKSPKLLIFEQILDSIVVFRLSLTICRKFCGLKKLPTNSH